MNLTKEDLECVNQVFDDIEKCVDGGISKCIIKLEVWSEGYKIGDVFYDDETPVFKPSLGE